MSAPTVWFIVCDILLIIFGLHLAHIGYVGWYAYIEELMKKHQITRKVATDNARIHIWCDWVVIAASSIGAAVSLAISISHYITRN